MRDQWEEKHGGFEESEFSSKYLHNNLREILGVSLHKTKGKYLRRLGNVNSKYVETLKMFEKLAKIADDLCQGVNSDDDFEKLKHRVVPIHPFAVREMSVWNVQIRKRLRRKAYVKTGWKIVLVRDLPKEIFERIMCLCTANTCYETNISRSSKEDIIQFMDVRKVNYIFKQVGVSTSLKKVISNVGTAKVIVCAEKPFNLVYLKSKEQLKVIAHFGFWNVHGVAQF